jgi:hypothetical protein
MEHSTDFTILLVGRVLGGISTNLLFSAFESWMTTEHRKKGKPIAFRIGINASIDRFSSKFFF